MQIVLSVMIFKDYTNRVKKESHEHDRCGEIEKKQNEVKIWGIKTRFNSKFVSSIPLERAHKTFRNFLRINNIILRKGISRFFLKEVFWGRREGTIKKVRSTGNSAHEQNHKYDLIP